VSHLLEFVFQDRIDAIAQAADQFVAAGHFDADNIKAKQLQLADRFKALHEPMQARRQKLRDALRLQQFYRDVEDEEDWIREKEPIAASANRGMLLINLCTVHFAKNDSFPAHCPGQVPR
jgi:spectrin alpha